VKLPDIDCANQINTLIIFGVSTGAYRKTEIAKRIFPCTFTQFLCSIFNDPKKEIANLVKIKSYVFDHGTILSTFLISIAVSPLPDHTIR
jgi:hypothetical protein